MRAKYAVILAVVCLQPALLAETPLALNARGIELFKRGEYAESEKLFHQALARHKAATALDVNGYAATLNNLAGALLLQGKHREAEPPLRESASLDNRIVSEPHIVTSALNNLAILHEARHEFPQAVALLRRVLDRPGLQEEDRAGVLHNIGSAYFLTGQHKKAKQYFEASLEPILTGGGTTDTAGTLAYLARIALLERETDRARRLLERALEFRRKFLGDNHPLTGLTLNDMAEFYRDTKQMDEANATFRRALAVLHATVGKDHPHVAIVSFQYGQAKLAQGAYAEALNLYRDAIRILETTAGPSAPTLAPVYKSAGMCAAKLKRKQESKMYASRAKALTQGVIPYKEITIDVLSFRSSK